MIAGHLFDQQIDEQVTQKHDDGHESGFLGSERDKDYRIQNKWHMGKPVLIPGRPQNAQKRTKTVTFQQNTSSTKIEPDRFFSKK